VGNVGRPTKLGASLWVILALVLGSCGRSTSAKPPTSVAAPTTVVATSTSTGATSTTATRAGGIPVVECPTTYGVTETPPSKLPDTMALNAPAALASQLAYYSNDTRSLDPILAPRGWDCRVTIGADGSTEIAVYPPGAAVPSPTAATATAEGVVASSTSACQGCTYTAVCMFVPAAGQQLGFAGTGLACAKRPPGEQVTYLKGSPDGNGRTANDEISFLDPPGLNGTGVPSGGNNPANGVVLYRFTLGSGGTSATETCTLPAPDHALCTAVLNDLATRSWMVGP
jgi:hypothetical protein